MYIMYISIREHTYTHTNELLTSEYDFSMADFFIVKLLKEKEIHFYLIVHLKNFSKINFEIIFKIVHS